MRSTPTLLSPQMTRSGRWPANVAVSASLAAWRPAESSILPGCTSATRTVEPTGGVGPSRNHAGPSPAHASAIATAMTRPDTPRCRITAAIAVLAATSRTLVSQTPPSEAEASVAG